MFYSILVLVFAAAYSTDGCLNNYVYKKSQEKSWCSPQLGSCSVQGAISPTFDGTLRDWRIEMKFKGDVKRLKTFTAKLQEEGDGETPYILTAKSWNPIINSFFNLDYIVIFPKHEDRELECVQFCGTLDNGEKLCEDNKEDLP